MKYAIAVIDIGMTNKKVAVYDDMLRQVEAEYRTFPPIPMGDLEIHDLAGMEQWFIERLKVLASRYPIKAIAITTHGATFVCVGDDGKPCVPCVLYTYEPGDAFHDHFYKLFGSSEALQVETGTPYFKAMINPAKGILFAKERFPKEFKRTRYLLNYPQYWGYRLSDKTGAEGTYTGCHSYLWDWSGNRWSDVARKLGIIDMIPSGLRNSWDVLGSITEETAQKTGLSPDVIVTMGIHDSNSSLLPHFAKKGETGFVLNSTGTWCVIMNPVNTYGFVPDEIGKVVFFNQSAFRKPVKTAIFLGGLEYESWTKLFPASDGKVCDSGFDKKLYDDLLNKKELFILPEIVAGSGQFPGSVPRVVEAGKAYLFTEIENGKSVPPSFRNPDTARAALVVSLVIQTLVSVERAGIDRTKDFFTEGGFRKNIAYNALLSSALPDHRVSLTNIAEATAFGAAMTGKMAFSGKKLADLAEDFSVEYTEIPKQDFPGFDSYRRAWLELVENK
jgi:sugar (pentulose or hexulose) kinase